METKNSNDENAMKIANEIPKSLINIHFYPTFLTIQHK